MLLIFFISIVLNLQSCSNYSRDTSFAANIHDWEYSLSNTNLNISEIEWQKVDDSILTAPFGYTGFIYYKAKIDVNPEYLKSNLGIYLDRVSDVDKVYFNGKLIGKTGDFPPNFRPHLDFFRLYLIPSEIIKENNILFAKTYVGYGVTQGIPVEKVDIQPYTEYQTKWHFNHILWMIGRLATAILCLILVVFAIPWMRQPKYDFKQIIVLFIAISGFVFSLCYSRLEFHFFSVLTSYKIHSISYLVMISSILIYALILSQLKIKTIFAIYMLATLVTAFAIISRSDLLAARQINRSFIIASTFYPFLGVVALYFRNKWKDYLLFTVILILYGFICIHDLLNTLSIINTERLSDYGVGLLLVSIIIQEANDIKNRIILTEKKLADSEKLTAIGRMAAQIAHDIRSPLSTVKTFVEIDQDELDDEDSVMLKEAALKCVNRLSDMADELLNYSKATKVEKQNVDIAGLVKEVLLNVKQSGAGEDIFFEYKGPDKLESFVDEMKVNRVITNLLKNAAEATPASGRVTIKLTEENNNISIIVRDTGKGIAPDHLPQIFDSTFTFGKKGGTGLGLAYCKNVIEAHGGKIKVSSEEGKGTEFTITLPK